MDAELDNFSQISRQEDLFSFTITSAEAGWRFDHYVAHRLGFFSRSQIHAAIKKGTITINDVACKAARKLRAGDHVRGYVAAPVLALPEPQQVDFSILFEDEHLLMVDKPPHLVVHPANGNHDNTLVNGLLYHCRTLRDAGDPVRPGIVHRLDKDTSGVMVVAKSTHVHRMLVEAFKARQVSKKYQAVVHGTMATCSGRVVAPIGRHPVSRKKMAIRPNSGKFAATNWLLKEMLGQDYSFVDIAIETGRTHQIRVHMASIGHPVAGDGVYGPVKSSAALPRQLLHSRQLQFIHPVTADKVTAVAPLPSDFCDILKDYGCPGDVL
ncbi:MAG: RluA family pseudouridine synthase [Desulfopila sp.]